MKKLLFSFILISTLLIGLTPVTWAFPPVMSQGGSGTGDMLNSDNLSGLTSVPSARNNLGLGVAQSPVFSTIALTGLTNYRIPYIGLNYYTYDSPLGSDGTNVTWTGAGHFGANGARVPKAWFAALESTELPTINGGTLATALGLATDSYTDNTVGVVCKDTAGAIKKCTLVGVAASGTTTPTLTGIGGTLGTAANVIPKANSTGGYTAQASGITEDGTSVNLGALKLVTTGTIQGGIVVNSDANGMSAAEMTTVGLYGTMFIATGAGTWILPVPAGGESLCLMSSGAPAHLILDTTTGSTIMLKGTELADAIGITNAGGDAAGDFVCVFASAAGKWMTAGMGGAWLTQ